MLLRLLSLVTCVLITPILTGCGGGGGGGSSTPNPSAPTLTLTPTAIKTFRLEWTAVSGTTEYRLLEDPDGSSGYSTLATLGAAARTYDHQVFLPGRINGRYIVRACAGTACSDSAPVHVTGALLSAIGYVKPSNTGERDEFGFGLALSGDGNTLAVGAFHEDSNAIGINGDANNELAADSGAVYVFTRTGTTWSQQAFIKASNTEAGDGFGRVVALSADGNTLAVGATNEDSAAQGVGGDQADNSAPRSGAVYVFRRTGSIWSQTAYIKASNSRADSVFGVALSLSGDGQTLAVSSTLEKSGSTGVNGDQTNELSPDSGAVYLFVSSGGAWSQQAYIKASNTGPDRFGISVALAADGNTLAIGAIFEDSSAPGIGGSQGDDLPDAGAVYVFTRTGSTWSQQAYIKPSDPHQLGRFGYFVALSASGDTLAVSTLDGDLDNPPVYVFVRLGTAWSQEARITTSTFPPKSLWALAISADGDTLVVANVADANPHAGLNGDKSFVPDPTTPGLRGAVFVFTRAAGAWREQAYIKASNTGDGDQFGGGVAISADGQTLAVGAHWEGSSATGINGGSANDLAPFSGAVYLF